MTTKVQVHTIVGGEANVYDHVVDYDRSGFVVESETTLIIFAGIGTGQPTVNYPRTSVVRYTQQEVR